MFSRLFKLLFQWRRKPRQIPPLTVFDILTAAQLFKSKTEMRKAIQNKAVKINTQQPDNLEEKIELGDFLNFVWMSGAAEMVKIHGTNLLAVSAGKSADSKAIVKLTPNGLELLS